MTLAEMREELAQQAVAYIDKAAGCTDEKLKHNLIAKAEQTTKYVVALDRWAGKQPEKAA